MNYDNEQLQELYELRAEWVELESDVSDAKKYMKVNGAFWRLFTWIEDRIRYNRELVQKAINDINTT